MKERRKPKAVRTINSYLRLKAPKGLVRKEFWTNERIEYLRRLSETGKAALRSLEDAESYAAGSRALRDRISFTPLPEATPPTTPPDTSVTLGTGQKQIPLSIPLVWGDMSFGAIHANAVKALVKSAEVTGILSGTGEGGLLADVRQYKRFNVQWASARFGVDLETLNSGMAIIIKIGQGAKPGIGGHLPGTKVVGEIPKTRRFPEGRDAISPAPHHDIYSIEDLGQRIWALKVATGQPVFVKVAATNYAPYIACGIARMGADGVVIDGHLAGTGATPEVIRDNVGIPIELAVAAADQMLREQLMDGEPLRNRISIIAGGGVTSSTDILKLVALGADSAMMGTGPLVSMGCVMVHRCHTGRCPTAIATQTPHRLLDWEWAAEKCINMVRGFQDELQIFLSELGLESMRDAIGRREILQGRDLNPETLRILGIPLAEDKKRTLFLPLSEADEDDGTDFWPPWRIEHIETLAKTGEALITSMGSLGPPFVEPPRVICDWLRSDGAQVTRPSIDPYREEIETSAYLADGAIRLAVPCFFDLTHFEDLNAPAHTLLMRTAAAVGTLSVTTPDRLNEDVLRFGRAILLDVSTAGAALNPEWVERCAGLLVDASQTRPVAEMVAELKAAYDKPLFVRIPPTRNVQRLAVRIARAGADGILVRDVVDPETGEILWDLSSEEYYPLEVAVSLADAALRSHQNGGRPLRRSVNLIAEADRIRGAEDIFKLIALGAEAVGIGTLALVGAVGKTGEALIKVIDEIDFESETARTRLENLFWGIQKEIKLLLGAAGTSSAATLVSSHELLRAVDLDPEVRSLLDVKPAGI